MNLLDRSFKLRFHVYINPARYIYDAKWQNPFHSAKKITNVLEGKHKPIYSPNSDCGDHVVVINSRHVALLGREWKMRVYFHHPGYNKVRAGSINGNRTLFYGVFQSYQGGGAKWIPAWELHSKDPTLVLWKACYNNLAGDMFRKPRMAQLHVYADGAECVPEEILSCVNGQLEQVRPVPKALDEFSSEEISKFPKLWDYPEEYVVK